MGWQWSSPYQLHPAAVLPPPRTTEQDLMGNHLLELYTDFSEIVSTDDSQERIKARLNALFCYADSQALTGRGALENLRQLVNDLHWELLDARRFASFYRFVFYLCREKGQKNITVSIAVEAWKLVLTGRFRLLDQWCEFVLGHHRHAISEDTWRQVLEFSRVVHEDLSNYDPEVNRSLFVAGAWPVLVDEFVDHMYRNSCTCTEMCNCQPSSVMCSSEILRDVNRISTLPGMAASAGSKRRRKDTDDEVTLSRGLKRLLLEKPLLLAGGYFY